MSEKARCGHNDYPGELYCDNPLCGNQSTLVVVKTSTNRIADLEQALTASQLESADFRRLVADMRAAQKAYFKYRTSSALEFSKSLERRVDAALKDNGQGELFQEKAES